MGRKKKNQDENKSTEKTKSKQSALASGVKRSVVAIFLFALALVVLLGFLGQGGAIGAFLDKAAGLFIGWAKWVAPIFLIIAGVVLILRKETSFYVSKLIGLTLAFLSITGFMHLFYDTDKMAKFANEGAGGGYVGYAIAYLATKLLGRAGGFIVIIALFSVGIIVAFNFSIVHFIENLVARLKEEIEPVQLENDEEAGQEEDEKTIEPEEIGEGNKEQEKEENKDGEDNIGKIEFVDGPDRYVDEKLITEASKKSNKVSKKNDDGFSSPSRLDEITDDEWQFPPLDLLEKGTNDAKGGDVEKNAEIIERTLRNFGIEVERGEIKTGPSVTQYSFRPAVGIKISRILALQNDLALALAAHPIRIEAPIPGKSLIGIEVPNKSSAIVRMRDILESEEFTHRKSNLTLALGEDVSGSYIFGNLDKMPHLMIAGATGTGKSVGINAIITALLFQNSPKDLKFIMVDPKRVELSLYNGIPHLLSDVIVENGKVVSALKWAVGEMERRYRLLQDTGSRDILSYTEKLRSGKKRKYTDPETGESVENDYEKLPYIVIIIDELADLMGTHGKEVEGAIVRLAQMARAVGIHLIVSTQRPSVEVITGLIKANITTRIAFQVATQIDSRTILDMSGAEKLLGNGDMLYLSSSSPKPKRIQGVFVSEAEVKKAVKFIKSQKVEEELGENIVSPTQGAALDFKDSGDGSQEDDLYGAAKEEVIRAGKASASLLQRRLRVGYARAARLLDILEDNGVIGPADGAKPREVYAAKDTPQEAINYDSAIEDQSVRDKWQI